jgi:hypothetical protein
MSTADILGKVTDPSGAAMPQSKVTAKSLVTAEVRTATADENGDYLISLLPVGHYSVQIEHSGFKTWAVPDVAPSVNDRLRLDATLQVDIVTESLEVTAKTLALQTDSWSLSTPVTSQAVQDLPRNIGSRQFVNRKTIASTLLAANTHNICAGTLLGLEGECPSLTF